jgi:hypothetical protein
MAEHFFGYASQQQAREPGAAVRWHDDQVDLILDSVVNDRLSGLATHQLMPMQDTGSRRQNLLENLTLPFDRLIHFGNRRATGRG